MLKAKLYVDGKSVERSITDIEVELTINSLLNDVRFVNEYRKWVASHKDKISGPGSPPMMQTIVEAGQIYNRHFGVWAVSGIVMSLNKKLNINWGSDINGDLF
jgi:hypothetical protein